MKNAWCCWSEDYDLEGRVRAVEREVARPFPVRDLYVAAAFHARLSRGEAAKIASKGAEEDADALLMLRAEKARVSQAKFRDGAEKRRKIGLTEAGWVQTGNNWKSPYDGAEYSFAEASRIEMVIALRRTLP